VKAIPVFKEFCKIGLNVFSIPSASADYKREAISFCCLCMFNFLQKVQILVKVCIEWLYEKLPREFKFCHIDTL
jgi:hypothetical protein